MPDISELNGTAINNVAEFDGLTVTEAAGFTGLLDETYGSGAAAAYSVRRLASATTVLLRVRRETGAGQAGNDDEADVGFDSNDVLSLDSPVSNFSVGGSNATTLGQFLNVGTVNGITYTDADTLAPNTAAAYVDGWKDQSGNGNDAEQGTPASQLKIHVGTADTDLITANGKPALQKNNRPFALELTTSLALSDFCVSWAGDRDSLRDEGIMLANTAGTEYLWDRSTLRFEYHWDSTTTTTGATGVGPKLYVINKNGSSINNRINGTAFTATLAGTFNVDLLIPSGVNTWEGEINEIVIWDSSKATEQTDIEDNINAEFGIY